ncbi:TonB-dependent receptor domain-containing protein [Marinobacterium iners]|uniref:Hemoglobin/transferrin/lactoferrin receptor protein n=1 Tax=Marinobacterium iners DSM 11526 TaxID=1122198 RepID=A0A1H3Y2A2_9GAMM|nr:TonB-dependent receptor [Marinobacterium iners]SEA04952.1 hemoglobin/transferrin/lactoferrin receptor protein [Marinobacterium iners DSM 11526]
MNVSLYQEAPRLKPLALAVMLAMSQVTMEVAQAETVVQVKESLDDCSTSDTAEVNGGKECTDKDVTDKDVTSNEVLPVIGSETTVIQGRDLSTEDVYLRDISNVHATRENIENYKGTSVGDLFKGLNGVYTGEARNSGALDPNIRGIQGTGRVPVLVDGTEQSTTIWLGPGGISNRSYVDPNLVGGITAEKGPSFEGPSGIGGAVRIRTLEPGDIIQPGKTWGIELKTETATNTVAERDGANGWYGQDYRDVKANGVPIIGTGGDYGGIVAPLGGGVTLVPESGSDHQGFNGEDYAWRLAVAAEQEHFDLIGVHSYRRSGNYFAGENGADAYRTEDWIEAMQKAKSQGAGNSSEYNDYLANLFRPGQEVLNTHSEMTSTLLKGRLELPHNQELSLSWMNTEQIYGESNVSIRMIAHDPKNMIDMDGTGDMAYQYNNPPSEVDQDTWNLGYSWNPDNPLIDLKVGAWATQSFSVRHQNGGFQYQPMETDRNYNNYLWCSVYQSAWPEQAAMYENHCRILHNPDTNPYEHDPDYRDESIDGTLVDASRQEWNHDRYGLNVRNRFQLSPDFALTLSADAQHEELDGWDASEAHLSKNPFVWGNSHMGPRAGTRREYNAAMQMEWFPTDTVMITGGLKWSRYWSFDDGLDEHRRNQHRGWAKEYEVAYAQIPYGLYLSEEQTAQLNAYLARAREISGARASGTLTDEQRAFAAESNAWLAELTGGNFAVTKELQAANEDLVFYGASSYGKVPTVEIGGATYLGGGLIGGHNASSRGLTAAIVDYADGDFRGMRDRNPFYNGTLDINETVTTADGKELPKYLAGFNAYNAETGERLGTTSFVGNDRVENPEKYKDIDIVYGPATISHVTRVLDDSEQWSRPQKRRNEAWAPMLGITWFMTPHNRVYARYSEYVRFPSLWEDTQSAVGYGSYTTGTDVSGYSIEPERTRNIELGYVQDLTPWLSNVRMADVRLNYYRNRIENYIDRNVDYQVLQFDEKRTEGIELQARVDTGRYFAGLGATYRLNNDLCDADYAATLDPYNQGQYAACVDGGFPLTFTRTSTQPELSINLDGGMRLMGDRLELGGRVTYHSSAENEDEQQWIDEHYLYTGYLNEAYNLESVLVYDAYATYEINNVFKLNAGVNNITDEYYLDPLTRTLLPAPGRTFKLGLTARF